MGRRKKFNRLHETQCRVCPTIFEAVRDDARYCSPKCRQAISRAQRAAASGTDTRALKVNNKTVCAECGIARDGRAKKCPVCRSTKTKTAK